MARHSTKELIHLLFTKRMLVVTFLGISSGLPIMVVYKSMKLWLRSAGVELSTIGFFSWIALPYSYNFLWAFLFDRYTPIKSLGRRRGWLLITQVSLVFSFLGLALVGSPANSMKLVVICGFLLCFFSASQDVAVDAYRNEILSKDELGVGGSFGVYGYRIGMWLASGFGIWVVDKETWNWSFSQMFMMMALFMAIGIITTLLASEPSNPEAKKAKSLKESVISPFIEFLRRPQSVTILFFIFFYKFGDAVAGSMSTPFYADLGFSNKDIGEVASTLGLFSSMLGLFIGGSLVYKKGYFASLWVSGILQAISTALFAFLIFGATRLNFSFVVFFEDLSSGMGTAALVGYMGSLVNKQFTATQYALLASLASFARTIFSGFAGEVIELFQENPLLFSHEAFQGYLNFYILGSIMAIPGLFLLYKITPRAKSRSSA